MIRRNLKT